MRRAGRDRRDARHPVALGQREDLDEIQRQRSVGRREPVGGLVDQRLLVDRSGESPPNAWVQTTDAWDQPTSTVSAVTATTSANTNPWAVPGAMVNTQSPASASGVLICVSEVQSASVLW